MLLGVGATKSRQQGGLGGLMTLRDVALRELIFQFWTVPPENTVHFYTRNRVNYFIKESFHDISEHFFVLNLHFE